MPRFIEKLSPDMDEGSAASIMVASYAIGTTLGSLISGPISDRVGRRPVLLTGLVLCATSYFLAANAWNIISFACFRALGGLATGNRPALVAYLVDTSDPRDLTFYGVLLSLSVNAGISIGPMIGGALALVTIEVPLYFFGGICSALFVLLFILLRESRQKLPANATNDDRRPTSSSPYAHQQAHPSKWLIPTTALLALIGFCAQYLLTGWSTVFGLLGAERYGLNSAQNGLALGLQACVIVVLCILYIPITEHLLSPALTGTVGLAISCLLVIVPFLHNVYWTAVLGTVVGVGCSLYFCGIAYFVNIISPGSKRGFLSSLLYTSSNLGAICGPIISGILYDADSARRAYPFYCFLALSFLATLCCGIVDCGIKYTLRRLST
ncbi:hypothetical protein FOZ63_028776 [Perkinsus olseni]|uniref:Major facilitator superfamily (MFS) profile domain-containing protein n=1 Tax=Perkinsus olseni TaxID=32597 RepID=A0A7J6UN50_PEROL|nr:hypothetical protein FOZ63_028776 [Perkinsus olseni]